MNKMTIHYITNRLLKPHLHYVNLLNLTDLYEVKLRHHLFDSSEGGKWED